MLRPRRASRSPTNAYVSAVDGTFGDDIDYADAYEHASVHPTDQRAHKEAQQPSHALSLYFVFYNGTRIHKTLRVMPATAAGLTDRVWGMEEMAGMMDAVAPKLGWPKTYKKREVPKVSG